MVVSLGGALERTTASALAGTGHDSSAIAADAGPLGGTLVLEQAERGYIALGIRQRVEPTARRPAYYRGGSFSDYGS